MGWVHYTKRTLDSIKKLTLLSQNKFSDKEFGNFLRRRINEEIDQADLWLNSLLDYCYITTPLQKSNTVNTLVEELSKKYQTHFEEREVRLFKTLEKDLPEIIVSDEPLKYILNSALHYIMASTPRRGKVTISTKSFPHLKDEGGAQTCFGEFGGGVEISVASSGEKVPSLRLDSSMDLMLRMIQEMVQKNQGILKWEANEGRSEIMISLRFPMERRKVLFYEPMVTNPPNNLLKILDN
ncbi:MAG: hypothetical protein HXY44_02625 [Syntrophaceae bacterium]|nr:hypothetical protein [Syntrophaceae bacterium]